MVLVVVLQVDGELVDAEVLQCGQPLEVRLDRADDAEPIDDLVGHELGVGVAGLAVLVVVVALAALDVVGERLRHRAAVIAVPGDDVGHVVADHATEPAALVAHVGQTASLPSVTYAGAATQIVMSSGSRPAAAAASRTAPIVHSAIERSASCRMKPSPTSPVERQRLRPVRRDPHLELRCRPPTGSGAREPLYSTLRPLASSRMTWIASRKRGERGRRAVGDPHGRVAAADAADRAVAVHLVERGVRLAVTVQSRVAGLVTIGPTITLRVSARIWL